MMENGTAYIWSSEDVTGKISNILMLLYHTSTALSYDLVTLVKQVYHKKYRLGTNFLGKPDCFLQPAVSV
jgi:hypothetical protein